MSNMGYVEVILGTMFSGKTTELMKRVSQYKAIGMRCLVINHCADTRVEGDYAQSHDGNKCRAIKTEDLLLVNTKGYDVVAIDEGQFFLNLRSAVMIMAETNGQHVIVAGLSGDFQRNPFGEMLDLIPVADDVQFKRALCKTCCHPARLAAFTKRLSEEKETVSVHNNYIAVCRMCFIK